MTPLEQDIPYGFCKCGCGKRTKISNKTTSREGYIKGQPRDYCHGHGHRIRRANPRLDVLDERDVYYIDLTHGLFAIIDANDLHIVCTFEWRAKWDNHSKTYYACAGPRNGKTRRHIQMHRLLMGLEQGDPLQVDHKNGNGLDNRRSSNIRVATVQQNSFNNKRKSGKSGKRGVQSLGPNRNWRARIRENGKDVHLGVFSTPEEAYAVYCAAVKEKRGEFGRTQ
jgi:HNH endonuclease